MSKIVKQRDFNEAFELSKNGGNVFALVNKAGSKNPIVKNVSNLSIKELLTLKDSVVYITIEEA